VRAVQRTLLSALVSVLLVGDIALATEPVAPGDGSVLAHKPPAPSKGAAVSRLSV